MYVATAATAAIGAIVGLAVNAETARWAYGGVTGAFEGTEAVAYKRVADTKLDVSFEVPEDWLTRPSTIGALRTGEPVGDAKTAQEREGRIDTDWAVSYVTVGTSELLLDKAGIADSRTDPVDALMEYMRTARWELDFCELVKREPVTLEAHEGVIEEWRDCGGKSERFTFVLAVPADRGHVLYVQANAGDERYIDVYDRAATSLRVGQRGGDQ